MGGLTENLESAREEMELRRGEVEETWSMLIGVERDQNGQSQLVKEETAELRQELNTAMRRVEEMRAVKVQQQHMVENIIQQKDMYKSMATSGGAAPAAATLARPADAGREEILAKELEEANEAQIQQNLERREEEGKLRPEVRCEQLRKELELMRKRVDQEQNRNSVQAWERTNTVLRERAEGAENREQMVAQTDTIGTMVLEEVCPGPILPVVAGNAKVEHLREEVVELQEVTCTLRLEAELAQTVREKEPGQEARNAEQIGVALSSAEASQDCLPLEEVLLPDVDTEVILSLSPTPGLLSEHKRSFLKTSCRLLVTMVTTQDRLREMGREGELACRRALIELETTMSTLVTWGETLLLNPEETQGIQHRLGQLRVEWSRTRQVVIQRLREIEAVGSEELKVAGGSEELKEAGGSEELKVVQGSEELKLAGGSEKLQVAGGSEEAKEAGGSEELEVAEGSEELDVAAWSKELEGAGGCEEQRSTEVEEQQALQKCEKCFSSFRSLSALNEHARTPGLCQRKKSKQHCLSCPRCSKTFSRRSVWSHHVTYSLECQAKKMKKMSIPHTEDGRGSGGEGEQRHEDVIMESEDDIIAWEPIYHDHCYGALSSPEIPATYTPPPARPVSAQHADSVSANTPAAPPVHRDYVSSLSCVLITFIPNRFHPGRSVSFVWSGRRDPDLPSELLSCWRLS